MRVARRSENVRADIFEGSINAFLDAHATKRAPSATPAPPSFTKDEAEYVLKINARAERGVDGERDVAARKLEKIAAEHGMPDAAALVEKARAMVPDASATPHREPLKRLPHHSAPAPRLSPHRNALHSLL